MDSRILCVDDEPNILHAFERQLRRFDITTASSGELGLERINEGPPFSVIVSDLRMPRMNGLQFLAMARIASPDTVRIMLTGQGDLSAAAEAVNDGNVFRFLLKPCPSEILGRAIDAALEHRRLVQAERELLKDTLSGAVEVLSEILSMVNPEAFGRACRMRRYVRHLSVELKLTDPWQFEIAAMLSQIGCVAVPQEILEKLQVGETLTSDELKVYSSHSQVGHDLLVRIPRLGTIAQMIRQQKPPLKPADIQALEPVELGREILRLAAEFDESIVKGISYTDATAKLSAGRRYCPALVAAMETLAGLESENEIRAIRVAEIRSGMRVAADVRSKRGLLLLGRGQEITPSVMARLKSFSTGSSGVAEPLTVVVRRELELEVGVASPPPAMPVKLA